MRNVSRRAINDKARAAKGAMSNTAVVARFDRRSSIPELRHFSISSAAAYWISRWSLSSGAHLRDPLAGETLEGGAVLLLRQLNRKLAVADAYGKTFDEFRHRVFAVGSDQFSEGREQAGLRQAIAIDAIVPRFRPGLVEITEGSLFLLVIGQWVVGGCEGRWMAHGTQQMCARVQGGARRMREV
jgi:hypothetical protein